MPEVRPVPNLGPEVRRVAAEAAAALGRLPYARQGGGLERALGRGSIVVLAPFLFIEALPFDGALGAARTLALANAFGAAHFLAQDRLLDGDEDASPEASRFSDLGLALFVRENSRLFPADHRYWGYLDRYLEEYFDSLAWERRVLRAGPGEDVVSAAAMDGTLKRLGQRMSPLKACAAAVALLAGREERLGLMEDIVEDYHAAFQLGDDVADLRDDATRGRWSVVLRIIEARAGVRLDIATGNPDELIALGAASGALDDAVDLIAERYARARVGAVRLGARSLADHLGHTAEATVSALRWHGRRAATVARVSGGSAGGAAPEGAGGSCGSAGRGGSERGGLAPPGLHAFSAHGEGFAFDPRTGLFFHADAVALDVLAETERGGSESALAVLRMDHGRAAVDEVLDEVAAIARGQGLGGAPPPPSPGAVTTVALHVTERCNLSCDYCYLGAGGRGGAMSDDVAFRALDVLFDESLGSPRLTVVFFGGEPLLALGLIERVADRARDRAAADGRTVGFHLTTNGTLLTRDAAARLAALDVGVLVSVDGDRAGHDAHRRFADGMGSYDTVAANVASLPCGFRVGARATVTEDSPPLPDLVRHLTGLGFTTVYLSPVSGGRMAQSFATRLCSELDALALAEMERVRAGAAPVVGNFIEQAVALERGGERRLPCGAGAHYLSVAADGTLVLCHRFAGDPARAVGDVVSGFDRAAARRALEGLVARAEGCERCWARALCGGPCYHDLAVCPGEASGESAPRCRVRRRVFELAMWFYAGLPETARRRLADAARTVLAPPLAPPATAPLAAPLASPPTTPTSAVSARVFGCAPDHAPDGERR